MDSSHLLSEVKDALSSNAPACIIHTCALDGQAASQPEPIDSDDSIGSRRGMTHPRNELGGKVGAHRTGAVSAPITDPHTGAQTVQPGGKPARDDQTPKSSITS